MAKRQVVTMTDDLDPSKQADETLHFSIGNVSYEMDLTKRNAEKFRSALQPYIDAARRTGGRTTQGARAHASATGVDVAAVKAWADANGIPYNQRGRLSADLVARFRQAME